MDEGSWCWILRPKFESSFLACMGSHYVGSIGWWRRGFMGLRQVRCWLMHEQRVKQIRRPDIEAWYVFIAPLSMETLESRLCSRRTEKESI
jgi:hypothetical protein